jgi:hypothetical protein
MNVYPMMFIKRGVPFFQRSELWIESRVRGRLEARSCFAAREKCASRRAHFFNACQVFPKKLSGALVFTTASSCEYKTFSAAGKKISRWNFPETFQTSHKNKNNNYNYNYNLLNAWLERHYHCNVNMSAYIHDAKIDH